MERAKILVVEDEVIVAQEIKMSLLDMGYDVVGAVTTGEEAVEEAEKAGPHAVLMDIRLAGAMDGVEAARRIRREHDIPVIFVTAHADKELIERARITEPFGYILKPFDAKELRATIEMALYKRKMEALLKEWQERYRLVADFTYDWEMWRAPDGEYVYVSPSCERITGYPREAFLQDPGLLEQIVHPSDREMVAEHFRKEEQTEDALHLELRILTLEGKERWISRWSQPVYNDRGVCLGRRSSSRDVTRRVRMEELYLRARKFETLGILSGGLAHDFNNLLSIILGNIELALMDIEPEKPHTKLLGNAHDACLQAIDLTRKFITLSEGAGPVRKSSGLKELIQDAANLALNGSNVTCRYSFPKESWLAEVDILQFSQVMHNVVQNARESMPEGGEVEIALENLELTEGKDGLRFSLPKGKYIKIVVKDRGRGIKPENLDKVFDPYFSTKERGAQKGMGLGLTLAYSIVCKHSGNMHIESQEGKGTSVTIMLPASEVPE